MISVVYPRTTLYINLIRDIYEAFILFVFFYLMNAYIGYDTVYDRINDDKVYEILMKTDSEISHMCPISICTSPYRVSCKAKAKFFVYRCKRYIMQFLIIKPGASLILLVM